MTAWKANVPAPRYELFTSAFEKKVAAYQEIIRATEKSEQVYNICRDALERAKLPNDVKLDLAPKGVSIEIEALPTDKLALFQRAFEMIGEGLVAARLRNNTEPAIGDVRWRSGITAVFHVKCPLTAMMSKVEISVYMPSEGIADLDCVTETVTYSSDLYKMVPRNGTSNSVDAAKRG